jgi:hypothetical protein
MKFQTFMNMVSFPNHELHVKNDPLFYPLKPSKII